MSYQVLARKWRPQKFEDVVGQRHVLQPLISALESGRLHHAYLFTGTRGVGKTTIARILAKSLNCEAGIQATPCGQCSACQEIDSGRFVDLLEIDAASRTKVEDTRELLDNVQYRPTRGRFKVYLIDEVHMLSRHSFNALLKTLEEPPEHVKFLLATTDPQKLPVTVLSRCLQFNLKALNKEEIAGHLKHVLTQEQIPFAETALPALARAAQGSLRDALSLTDQAIAQGQQQVSEAAVQMMLGAVPSSQVYRLLTHIMRGEGEAMLQLLDKVAAQIPDLSSLLAELQTCLHQLALVQVVPSSATTLNLDSEAVALAKQLPAELVQVMYDITVAGRRDLSYAADVRSGVEMTLLRLLAFRPEYIDAAETDAATPTQVRQAASEVNESESGFHPQTPPADIAEEDIPDDLPEDDIHQAQAEIEAAANSLRGEPQPMPKPVASVQQEPVSEGAGDQSQSSAGTTAGMAGLLATRQQLTQKKKPITTTEAETKPSSSMMDAAPEVAPTPQSQPQPDVSSASAAPSEAKPTPAPMSEPEPATATEPAPTNTPMAADVNHPDAKLAAEIDRWSALVDTMDINGLTRQIGLQSELVQGQDKVSVKVCVSAKHLLNESSETALTQALAEVLPGVSATILVADETLTATPLKIQQQLDATRTAAAWSSLQGDDNVKALQNQFSATMIESSLELL